MKKVLLFVLLVFALVACAPVEQSQTSVAVQVPEALARAFEIGLVAVLAAGTNWLFQKIRLDLRQFNVPVAIAVAAWIVAELQHIINTIPAAYDLWIDMVLKIIVLLLGTVGLLALRQPPPQNKLM